MMDAEDSSSYSDIGEPQALKQSSSKLKVDPSYNLLFKLSVKISSENNLRYNVYFLNFPTLEVIDNKEGSIICPMSIDELSSYANPTLDLDAFQNDKEIGSSSLNVSECVYKLCKKIDEVNSKYPLECNLKRKLWLLKQNRREMEINVDFKLDCIGQTIVEDLKDVKEVYEENGEPDQEFDEYCAELNGHTLNIKTLRKPKKHGKNSNNFEGSYPNQNNEIIRKNSQIIFQLPSNQTLCTKSPQNAFMYNVGTCRQGKSHDHGNENFKVLPGKSSIEDKNKNDCFVIKLGKKGNGSEGKSRLELELKAPKLLGPEDFKKPSREMSTQTESVEASTKKKALSKKKGKKIK